MAGKLPLDRDEFDVPEVRRDSGDHERQRRLGELQKRFAVPLGGDEEFTGDFRISGFASPGDLTFAESPPRFGQVGRRQRARHAAATQSEHARQPEQLTQFAKTA